MVTSSTTKDLSFRRRDVDTQENLWSSILGEVQTQGNTKLPGCKNILVLGDNESGKTTLVAKLQGVEEPRKGSGLEYAYIDVRDEYRDDQTRLSVWVLDGDPNHSNLLRFALSEETYPHTLVILTICMTTPWGWMDQLQHWTTVLGEHIDKLSLTTDQRQSARAQVVRGWQNYCEPGDELEPGSPMKRNPKKSDMSRSSTDDLQESVEALVEGALSTNLGVEIVVVVTKTDYMMTLEKELDYRDEHWDFMQQWVRHFCLQHGAALFYTSAKEDKNCDLLYKYLMHRIYGLPFRTPALVVEKDAVLIPAGWDNFKKISILLENLHTCKPDDYYRDVIVPPATRKTAGGREQEVIAEDEQAFLSRQLALLHSGTPPGAIQAPLRSTESPLRNLANMPIPRITPNANQSPKKIDSAKGTPGGERVLANFFNSLLHKNTGSPSVAGSIKVTSNGTSLDTSGSPEQKAAAMRSDAAAELDRLTRLKQEPNSDLDSSEC